YSFTVKAIDFSGNVSAESAPLEVTTAVDPQLNVTASGENLPNEGIDKLYDDILTSKWLVKTTTAWVIYQYGVARKWDSYAITSGNDSPDRDPLDWTIEGSTDGVNWTLLNTQTGQSLGERIQTNEYSIANAAAYNYYKWNITANNGSDIMQAGELTYSLTTAISAIITNISDIRVYPNPSNGIINIEAKQARNSTVTVYDANGRVLLSKNINNEVERIDLSAFKGLLLVKVAGEGVVTTKKIIIK
ncbi:MAG: T9SS type A sorting domain-containing protein, partial [Bacteroidota bacterium]|nr:T9SS type A sorting domain-containing protein [Bacteroidota bacterium]